jgi:hypothetical protein
VLQKLAARWWRITACLLVCIAPIAGVWAQGSLTNAPDIDWASPSAISIKNLGPVSPTRQTEDINNLNYDCLPETYRYQDDITGTMHSGCFVTTAFGSVDIRDGVVNMTGLDGAVPLHAPGGYAVLPIPGAAGIATVSGAIPSGSYLHFYTYLPSQVQLQYDWLLQPYLQLPSTSSFTLSDSSGSPIIINAQSMAYSTNGSWMVVESPWHSFLRINMATFDILPFAPSFSGEPYDLAQHNSQVAISDDGRYAAIASDEFGTFKVYDLSSCTGTAGNLMPLICQSHDYRSYVSDQVPGWHLTRHLRFINDGLLSFHATGNGGGNDYLLTPAASIENLTQYLALGDSYSSGEGEFHYIGGTDTSNNKCHQSGNSYPYLLTRDVFGEGHSVACSGAIINDVKNTDQGYAGQVKDKIARNKRVDVDQILANFLPGYIAQWEFAQKYQPRVMTVGIGGNDIGFASILTACVEPHVGNNTCYGSYEDRKELTDLIDRTYGKWVGMYRQLQNTTPNTRIYAMGYPQIAAVGGDCGINVHLNGGELQFAHDLIDYLNFVIQKAATDSGVTYVDISHALDGHRLCESTAASVAVNGLTAGTDTDHVIGNESYHPNALGHELIEQAILHATHNFSDLAAAAASRGTQPSAPDNNPLLSAPKTGRNIKAIIPDASITGGTVNRGGGLFLTINGLKDGLRPKATYSVTLRNDGTTLGTITTDSSGNIENTVTIPSNASVGNQILDVTGTNVAGQDIDVTTTVYVATGTNDSDGDSIADRQDSCPLMINSGQDADQDGIDDACDGAMLPTGNGLTPTDPGSASSTATSNTPPQTTGTTAPAPGNTNNSTYITSGFMTTASINPSIAATQQSQNLRVLGSATTIPASTRLNINNHLLNTKDNLPTIHWLPWGIDVALFGLLLTLLNWLGNKRAVSR